MKLEIVDQPQFGQYALQLRNEKTHITFPLSVYRYPECELNGRTWKNSNHWSSKEMALQMAQSAELQAQEVLIDQFNITDKER